MLLEIILIAFAVIMAAATECFAGKRYGWGAACLAAGLLVVAVAWSFRSFVQA